MNRKQLKALQEENAKLKAEIVAKNEELESLTTALTQEEQAEVAALEKENAELKAENENANNIIAKAKLSAKVGGDKKETSEEEIKKARAVFKTVRGK